MPYVISGATIYGVYNCSHCGANGTFQQDGDEYADGTFGVIGMACPECDEDLDSDPEEYEDEDE